MLQLTEQGDRQIQKTNARCVIYLLKATKTLRGNRIVCSLNRHVRSCPFCSCVFMFLSFIRLTRTDPERNLPCFPTSSKTWSWAYVQHQAKVGDALRIEMPHRFDVCVSGPPGGGCWISLDVGCWGPRENHIQLLQGIHSPQHPMAIIIYNVRSITMYQHMWENDLECGTAG